MGRCNVTKGMLLKQALFSLAAVSLTVPAWAGIDPTLPNLVTIPVHGDQYPASRDFAVVAGGAFRCGGMKTLEFEVLTANIGGQDWVRPRSPDRGGFILRQLYQYTLFHYEQLFDADGNPILDDQGNPVYDYVQFYQGRKNTICIQDDRTLGDLFPCIQTHGAFFPCGSLYGNNGVSVGWADSYFRGLTGQYACIGSQTGSFLLTIELDPFLELDPNDPTLLDAEKDATHDDNLVLVYFDYDGTPSGLAIGSIVFGGGFDPAGVCPM
jgi:hypothetical protein